MKTILITGCTDGIGNGLAIDALKKGHRVIIIGRNPKKGKRFLQQAEQIDAKNRAHFFQVDLSLVNENKRIIHKIKTQFKTIDSLILCAQYFS